MSVLLMRGVQCVACNVWCAHVCCAHMWVQVLRYGIDEVLMMSRIWTNCVLPALEAYKLDHQDQQDQQQQLAHSPVSLASCAD